MAECQSIVNFSKNSWKKCRTALGSIGKTCFWDGNRRQFWHIICPELTTNVRFPLVVKFPWQLSFPHGSGWQKRVHEPLSDFVRLPLMIQCRAIYQRNLCGFKSLCQGIAIAQLVASVLRANLVCRNHCNWLL